MSRQTDRAEARARDERVRHAVAKVAEGLVGLSADEAWEALDRASVILPRREGSIGDSVPHDGDPIAKS